MSRILIQAPFEKRIREIQYCLHPLQVSTLKSNDKNSSSAFIKYESPLVFILDTFHLTSAILTFIDQLRKGVKFDRPIVLVLDETEAAFSALKLRKNVHVIARESIDTNLARLVEKLLKKPNLTKQKDPRYLTNNNLNVECVEDGRDLQSTMTNLSTSGAMVEFLEDPLLASGSLLKLKVQLAEVNSVHNMHAQVVWTKKMGKTGRIGCGVRFINEQAMYEELINRL